MAHVYIAGYDGSHSSARAVEFAERLGAATGARVITATVNEVMGWSGRGGLGVAERLTSREHDPVTHRITVGAMSVTEGLRLLAKDEDASLLVVGATHRGAVRRVVPGSVAALLLRGATCPVLVVPDAPPAAVECVGVMADAESDPDVLLTVADGLASILGARVVRLDVADARAELPGACGEHGVGLLVMGSHGLRPLREALAGSVSRHFADRAPCPLLLVPRGARTDLAGVSPRATA